MTNEELEHLVGSLVEFKHLKHVIREAAEQVQTLRFKLLLISIITEERNNTEEVFKILDNIENTLKGGII